MNDKELTMLRQAESLRKLMIQRRSVRSFLPDPVPLEILEHCIAIAGSAPSGANMQPWTFVLVRDPKVKTEIRLRAEMAERKFYAEKITLEWRERLKPLHTGPEKAFLEQAPWLICVFEQRYGTDSSGKKVHHFYPAESVGISVGMLISALHQTGLSILPYTPAPMDFLNEVLFRPKNEKPFIILAVGYPDPDYKVPDLQRKSLSEIMVLV
jgi:nitroreductase